MRILNALRRLRVQHVDSSVHGLAVNTWN